MHNELEVNFCQALEVFQVKISLKVNWCHVAQNIVSGSIFFCGLCLISLKSVGQALEGFQGQISVKVNGCNVAQNMVRGSNFFCGLCLMSLKSVLVKLWRDFKAK